MFNKNELGLIIDVLAKCHIRTKVTEADNIARVIRERGALEAIGLDGTAELNGGIQEPEPKTVYKHTDSFELTFIYFLLTDDGTSLVIGPYITSSPQETALRAGDANGIPPKRQSYLSEFYSAIPVIDTGNMLFSLLTSFCERLWEVPSFRIIDTGNKHASPLSPIVSVPKEDDFDETLAVIRAMERRYEFENELITAVSLGQIHKGSLLLSSFGDINFEKRVTDPLRNAQNYCIIMNTLVRKAAESGGVHPVHIDKVSSSFAKRIERIPHLSEVPSLMHDMFKTYCRLVREHKMKDYSDIVKSTVLLIDSDISAPLSTSSLATAQSVSAGYLSTVFRSETGTTLTQYITERRMTHAMHLIKTTNLQIQTVALHCGIPDLQYFSKIFKRFTGKTPKEYRSENTPKRQ